MTTATIEGLRQRGAYYRRLGIEPIINAMGTQTTHGGSIMAREVTEAMVEASQVMIRLSDLSELAGEVISRHTGAEAGLVVAGATAGMMLQGAACMAGPDPEKAAQLPDTAGMKDEIIIRKNNYYSFAPAWTYAGASLRQVGTDEGASQQELESAITSRTAALAFLASRWAPGSFETLEETVEVGRRHGIPVIVDAAAMLPPVENLRRFIELGADMVTFSGGKAIKGPQSTGILAGRKDLIQAAEMANSPHIAIGRVAKVCREEIAGLITALQMYVARDHAADQERWWIECRMVAEQLSDVPDIRTNVSQEDWSRPVPELSIALGDSWNAGAAGEIAAALEAGSPPIIIGESRRSGEDLFVNTHGLVEGEAEVVGGRLRSAMLANR